MIRPRLLAVLVAASVLAVTACGSSDAGSQPTLPDNAITLTSNQPRHIGEIDVVASLITDDGADLSGGASGEPATGAWVNVGETVEISGVTLRLVATWVDPKPGDSDGADRSKAWVVVE